MSHPVKGIDHCFILVNDLDAAAAQYASLGFNLSPRGLHSETKGSANHTIMFPDDYLELLGLLKPTEANAARRRALIDQGQGLHAIACRIDSAEDAARELEALGIATHGLGSFERPVPFPNGSTGVAAFSTIAFTPDEVPFGTVFMCQHKTRETVWIDELLTHPNTACGLGAFFSISDQPEQDGKRLARLWAAGKMYSEEEAIRIETGPNSAPLFIYERDAMAARFPGIDLGSIAKGAFAGVQILVEDSAALRGVLDASGVPVVRSDQGLIVPPEFAAGAIIEFVEKQR